MKCSNCGAPVQKDFNLCPYCGAQLGKFVDADDVYDKMDDIDDKLDNINDSINSKYQPNQYKPHTPSKAEETMGKAVTIIFFIVFITVALFIFFNAIRMFINPWGMY